VDLNEITIPKLQDICKELKIKKKGNKSEIIQRITSRQSYSNDDRKLFLQKLGNSFPENTENAHSHYRKNFNYVDLNQRVWNQPNYKRKFINWKAKFLFCTLKQFLINAWALMNEFEIITWEDFRKQVRDCWAPDLEK
jgi:hypothetical protein